jgi:hypothetical protein
MRTDLRATGVVFVNLELKKLVQLCGAPPSFEDLSPFLSSLEDEPIVVWGEAQPDLALSLRVRLPGSTTEQTLSAPIFELAEMLRDMFVRKGLCVAAEPPSWYRAPSDDNLAEYSLLLHNLLLQILADEKNGAVPPLTRDLTRDIMRCALDAADEKNHLGLIAVLDALYAKRAGMLEPVHQQKALELARGVEERTHPLYRLAPLALAELGEPLEAKARRQDLERDASASYREWLSRLASSQ